MVISVCFYREYRRSQAHRNSKVSMSGAGSTLEQEISVEQLGADPDILFDYSSDPLSFRGGTFTCKVVANVEWELEIAAEYDWIKLKEATPRTRSL